METDTALRALAALAQETRLTAYRLLVQAGPEGLAAGALAERLGVPATTLSFHLAQLVQAGLLRPRRAGRMIHYAAEYGRMNDLLGFLSENCCGQGGQACPVACPPTSPDIPAEAPMTDRPRHVLFLCTGNSARSIMAESLIDHWGGGRFRGFSAGSFPKGQVRPEALHVLAEAGMRTEGLRSKSWDEFTAPGAPEMDFVFTLCDEAAGETCPIWPGHPITAHWGIPDPAAVDGSAAERMLAFRNAFRALETRLRLFLSLPFAALDRLALTRKAREIGELDHPPATP